MSEPCNCVSNIRTKLAEQNLTLDTVFVFSDAYKGDGLTIKTSKATDAPRGTKTKLVFCNYCPFCGQDYDSREQK